MKFVKVFYITMLFAILLILWTSKYQKMWKSFRRTHWIERYNLKEFYQRKKPISRCNGQFRFYQHPQKKDKSECCNNSKIIEFLSVSLLAIKIFLGQETGEKGRTANSIPKWFNEFFFIFFAIFRWKRTKWKIKWTMYKKKTYKLFTCKKEIRVENLNCLRYLFFTVWSISGMIFFIEEFVTRVLWKNSINKSIIFSCIVNREKIGSNICRKIAHQQSP